MEKCESPIEVKMWCAFVCYLLPGCKEADDIEDTSDGVALFKRNRRFGGADIMMYQQAEIGRYRVDFALMAKVGERHEGVIVECDGHEFHERTKEQARRDRKRDRELQAMGWPVLRFTGSEIYANARGCADEALKFLQSKSA